MWSLIWFHFPSFPHYLQNDVATLGVPSAVSVGLFFSWTLPSDPILVGQNQVDLGLLTIEKFCQKSCHCASDPSDGKPRGVFKHSFPVTVFLATSIFHSVGLSCQPLQLAARTTLCASICWTSSNTKVTSENSLSSRNLPKTDLTFSLNSFHCRQSSLDISTWNLFRWNVIDKIKIT